MIDHKRNIIVANIGSDKRIITKSKFNRTLGLVEKLFEIKVKTHRGSWPILPLEFVHKLFRKLEKLEFNKFAFNRFETHIMFTSWALADEEKKKPDDENLLKCVINLFGLYHSTFLGTISQEGRAKFSEMSLNHILLFASKKLKDKGLVPSKVIQLEADKDSTQSAAILPKQSEEKGATWAEKLLDKGMSLQQIAKKYMQEQGKQFVDKSEIMGKDKIGLQGLLAIAMEDKEDDKRLLKKMKIAEYEIQDWNRGQKLVSLEKVVDALSDAVQFADQAHNSSQKCALNNAEVKSIIRTVYQYLEIKNLLPINKTEKVESKEEDSKNYDVEILNIIVKNLKEIPKNSECTIVQYEPAGILNDPAMKGKKAYFQNKNTMDLLVSYKQSLESLPKSIPKALAWGILGAFKKKYGSAYEVFSIKKGFPLFNSYGQPLAKDGKQMVCKPTWPHGFGIDRLLHQDVVNPESKQLWIKEGAIPRWKEEIHIKPQPSDTFEEEI